MARIKLSLFACAVAAVTAACQNVSAFRPATTVTSQDQAAAVLVSVTNVAPWDQVASTMQPNFALTGEQALLQVLPTTERIQEQVLRSFGATLLSALLSPEPQKRRSRSGLLYLR